MAKSKQQWMVEDQLWELIEPLIPPRALARGPGGRARISDRAALAGILFVLDTGCRWRDLPEELGCGSGHTAWRRLRGWGRVVMLDTNGVGWGSPPLSRQIALVVTDVHFGRGRVTATTTHCDGASAPTAPRGPRRAALRRLSGCVVVEGRWSPGRRWWWPGWRRLLVGAVVAGGTVLAVRVLYDSSDERSPPPTT